MNRKLLKMTLGTLLLAFLALGSSAWADTITFSGVSNGQGTLFFDPTALNPTLTVGSDGTNAGALISNLLSNVVGFSSCVTPGCAVTGGYLTLNSGNLASNPSSGIYLFGQGGSLNIFGGISSLGIGANSSLLSATFTNGSFLVNGGTTGTFSGNLDLSSIQLNPLIGTFDYTGASANTIEINLSSACGNGTGACKGAVTTASSTIQVPESSSLSFMGIGLLGLSSSLLRRLRK